jgi:amino acid transporter
MTGGASFKISAPFGVAIAAGVPLLVLVSLGPVAGLVGTASIVVWPVSALIGLFMALAFAELAGGYTRVNGGVAVLAADVLQTRSRFLARTGQWSYWFGWSPGLAINGLLVGGYLQRMAFPEQPPWLAAVAAGVILIMSATVNHFGMRIGARLQLLLVTTVILVIAVLVVGAVQHRAISPASLWPVSPPDGWLSATGAVGLAGAFFIAGWSAYGAELALSYAARYRSGVRDAVGALVLVAAFSVVAFGLVPALLLAVVGAAALQADPADAFIMLSERSTDLPASVILGALVLALVIGLNMVALASSWTLHQMSLRGDAPRFLGRLNRHGMPANALRFDVSANLVLITVLTLIARGNAAEVPIALLATANVGYFVSMILALWAAWLNHRRPVRPGLLRLRPGLARLAPVLAGFNLLLLLAAGAAWGWTDMAIGVAVLALALTFASLTRQRQPAPPVVTGIPPCLGRGVDTSLHPASAHRRGRWLEYDRARPNRVGTGESIRTRRVDRS